MKPGRDPGMNCLPPSSRTDVMELKDLKPGMELQGTVRNVIDFRCFVDIGVHQDGLVHISRLPRRVKHPFRAVDRGGCGHRLGGGCGGEAGTHRTDHVPAMSGPG